MFHSDEKIDYGFLIDDINDLLQLHLDVIEGYQQATKQVRDQAMGQRLEGWVGQHRDHIRELAELSRKYGGEPRDTTDLAVIGTRLRVALAQVFSDAGLAEALRRNEEKLLLEYERAINSLAALPGMETVLQDNAAAVKARMEELLQQS